MRLLQDKIWNYNTDSRSFRFRVCPGLTWFLWGIRPLLVASGCTESKNLVLPRRWKKLYGEFYVLAPGYLGMLGVHATWKGLLSSG